MTSQGQAARFDCFVSYTLADRAWGEWLAWQLREAGYTVFLDPWDITPGVDLIDSFRGVTEAADVVLVVLSDVDPELAVFSRAELSARALRVGGLGAILPVRVSGDNPSGIFAGLRYLDLVGLDEANARDALLDALYGIEAAHSTRGAARVSIDDEAPAYPSHAPSFSVPLAPSSRFVGRDDDMLRLDRALATRPRRMVALSGVGGIGKTRLAVEYAYSRRWNYEVVWWLRGESQASLMEDLGKLATEGPAAGPSRTQSSTLEQRAKRARAWLAANRGWLLIADDLKDPRTLTDLLPEPIEGDVIITTRTQSLTGGVTAVDLEPLNHEGAAKLLESEALPSGISRADFERLTAHLGGHPLSLKLAAAQLTHTRMSVDSFIFQLEKADADAVSGAERSLELAVGNSLRMLKQEVPVAHALLMLCSFLDASPLPTGLVVENRRSLPSALRRGLADPSSYVAAVEHLQSVGLITARGNGLLVHPMVAAIARRQLSGRDRRRWAQASVRLMDACLRIDASRPKDWSLVGQLIPNAVGASEYASRESVGLEEATRLLSWAGSYLHTRGDTTRALPLLRRAADLATRLSAPGNAGAESPWGNLGVVLFAQGDYEEARRHLVRALHVAEEAYGPEASETARRREDLALVLRALGERAASLDQLHMVLGIRERTMGPDDPETGKAHVNLAAVLRESDDSTGSMDHLRVALGVFERALGPESREVAAVRSSMAVLLREQGELEGARANFEAALRIYERVLGPRHENWGRVHQALAEIYRELGDLSRAEEHAVTGRNAIADPGR
ncbi:tetratricopeptide repeat protein [Geodermatophilus obscurus]|uniref:NB-ARC domain protein n=1 Tax=Geodermatophilus obscurus (strain ATCC 25078 / DSM 43160 / JCM 3152 / CCUG 61914 / KCC A-0152 / KCTC 9177 / NBRC 13315 / NRRL B-3577 / G-20) TaxID=526225 RepID=D2SB43_GEOOG|nr:toll/interleukin-1 receptor domain-containing protein [Geodermatophilus obscurus]ADB76078.1 NB-ARC domain protein [Geodermatophilus obscurus DSM 43160]